MGRALARTVIVTNPRTQLGETFRPGEPVPGWAADLITNPAAWTTTTDEPVLPVVEDQEPGEQEPASDEQPADGQPEEPDTGDQEPTDDEPSDDEPTTGGENALQQPPRSGKGSSLAAWIDYAEAAGITVPDGAERDDIIAAVEAAKH